MEGLEQTFHSGTSQKKGQWCESLSTGALGGLKIVEGEFARKLEVTKHQHLRRQASGPVLMDMQLWLSQELDLGRVCCSL